MRGQTAIELVTFLVLGILITLAFAISIGPYEGNLVRERKAVLGRDMLWTVAAEINGAASVGHGYSRTFQLPARLRDGTNFSMRIDAPAQAVRIYWGEGEGGYGLPMVTSNVTGQFVTGTNTITNANGLIMVNQ
jgi:hypothetical protein